MQRLAQVEVQLIMNYLTRVELTHLSRCSRRLFSDGDTDLAWRTQPLYDLPNEALSIDRFLSRPSSESSTTLAEPLFMRHKVGFSLTLSWEDLKNLSSLIRLFETIPDRLERVTFIDLSTGDGNVVWWELFLQTQLPRMTELIFNCDYMAFNLSRLLGDIRHLDSLRVLTLPHFVVQYQIKKADSVIGLRALPSLTSLTFTDVELQAPQEDEGTTLSTSIVKCEHLTQLYIEELRLNATEFNRVFTSSHLSQLKELTIDHWSWLDENPYNVWLDLLIDTWRSMTALEYLSFIHLAHMTRLVGSLKSCSTNLRSLVIFVDEIYPSSFSLHELLSTHPHLAIELTTNAIHADGTEVRDEEAHPLYRYLDEETKARFKLFLLW